MRSRVVGRNRGRVAGGAGRLQCRKQVCGLVENCHRWQVPRRAPDTGMDWVEPLPAGAGTRLS
jgi:hypothetical protein